ncbi:transposase family protein [Dactylosporangium matsuzakiense]|uniref:transposase family protein n=1 Tax=Dactylosporangium matsuzakiense TaxID=53360 RepID=UPI003F68A778
MLLAESSVQVEARCVASAASCPSCRKASRRVHSRYRRRLADLAIAGRQVLIRLTVQSKAPSPEPRPSNAPCTAAPTSTCSANASSPRTNIPTGRSPNECQSRIS